MEYTFSRKKWNRVPVLAAKNSTRPSAKNGTAVYSKEGASFGCLVTFYNDNSV